MNYTIRNVKPEDLEAVFKVERDCFPEAEAASLHSLEERIRTFPDSFFVAGLEDKTVIGFINGCVTGERTIRDEMFEDSGLHDPQGAYQSIFGLDVTEPYRGQGVAAGLMNRMIGEAKSRGRKGLILTCKEHLIPYYERFGYRCLGVSESVHGGAVWYDMILEFS